MAARNVFFARPRYPFAILMMRLCFLVAIVLVCTLVIDDDGYDG